MDENMNTYTIKTDSPYWFLECIKWLFEFIDDKDVTITITHDCYIKEMVKEPFNPDSIIPNGSISNGNNS